MNLTKSTTNILILLFVAAHIPLLLQNISHTHKWRQADTAAVSKNFHEESYNIFYPRVDIRGELTGITGMEFPLYQYVSSLFYSVIDIKSDVPGKFISLAAALTALFLLISLSGKMRENISEESLAIVYLTSPFVFFYSTAFMPELFSLALALSGIHYFLKYDTDGLPKHLAFSVLFLCLSSLSRPFLIFFCYPLLERFVIDLQHRRINWPVLAGGVFIIATFSAWYFFWAPFLVNHYGLDYFYFGSDMLSNMKIMLSASFWKLLFTTISASYLGWFWLPFALYGSYVLLKSGGKLERYLFMSSVLGILILGIRTGRHFSPHIYYLIVILPFAAYSAAAALQQALLKSKWNVTYVGIFLIVVSTLSHVHYYRMDGSFLKIKDGLTYLQAHIPATELVVVEDIGGYSYSLHHLRRKGWVLPHSEIESIPRMKQLRDKGAKWVVPLENGRCSLYPIDDWLLKINGIPIHEQST